MPKTPKSINRSLSKDKKIDSLIENNVALQRVITNLALEVNRLTKKTDNILDIIEKASREVSEDLSNPSSTANKEINDKESKTNETNVTNVKGDKQLLDKLDSLLKQNKTIARGLILLEGFVRERVSGKKEVKPLPEFRL